jgi:hypothetical protein
VLDFLRDPADLAEIEREIRGDVPYAVMAKRWRVHKSTLVRHAASLGVFRKHGGRPKPAPEAGTCGCVLHQRPADELAQIDRALRSGVAFSTLAFGWRTSVMTLTKHAQSPGLERQRGGSGPAPAERSVAKAPASVARTPPAVTTVLSTEQQRARTEMRRAEASVVDSLFLACMFARRGDEGGVTAMLGHLERNARRFAEAAATLAEREPLRTVNGGRRAIVGTLLAPGGEDHAG